MDFTPTEAQLDLGSLVRDIPPRWTELARAGVLSAALPKTVGGDGYGLLEQCSILVELGRAAAGVPYLSSIVVGASAIAAFGTDGQRERWGVPAARGELIVTAALAEDAAFHAEVAPGGWLVTGEASAVPALPDAGLVLVPTDAGVLAVAPSTVGVTVEPQAIEGGEGAGFLECAVPVPDDALIPGLSPEWLRERATIGLCAAQLGVVQQALEMTAAYARERMQFGRPIGTFQAVAQRLADGYVDVEGVRLTLWQAAWRLAEGLPCPTEVATAKFWAAEAGHRVAHTAVHIHGGVGVDLDHPVHRYFLAAKHHELALGGATAHLLRIGETLAAQ
jgi:alkylation response protein AidB-like acyl-CoA dehydrogenase